MQGDPGHCTALAQSHSPPYKMANPAPHLRERQRDPQRHCGQVEGKGCDERQPLLQPNKTLPGSAKLATWLPASAHTAMPHLHTPWPATRGCSGRRWPGAAAAWCRRAPAQVRQQPALCKQGVCAAPVMPMLWALGYSCILGSRCPQVPLHTWETGTQYRMSPADRGMQHSTASQSVLWNTHTPACGRDNGGGWASRRAGWGGARVRCGDAGLPACVRARPADCPGPLLHGRHSQSLGTVTKGLLSPPALPREPHLQAARAAWVHHKFVCVPRARPSRASAPAGR